MAYTYNKPLRLRAQIELSSRIEFVRPVNGYLHDLMGHVHRGRKYFGEETTLPMVSILEDMQREEQLDQRNSLLKSNYRLIVQCWVGDDETNPTDNTHLLAAEVTAVLMTLEVNKPFPNLPSIFKITVEPPLVRPSDEFSDIAYSLQRVVLSVAEDLSQPFDDA